MSKQSVTLQDKYTKIMVQQDSERMQLPAITCMVHMFATALEGLTYAPEQISKAMSEYVDPSIIDEED